MKTQILWRFGATFLALSLVAGCGGMDDESLLGQEEQAWMQGPAALRGHEDLTRFAVDYANQLVAGLTGNPTYFQPVISGDSCSGTTHRMLIGGCVTDSPDSTMTSFYGVSSGNWNTGANIQDLHFLRDYSGSSVVGRRAPCLSTQSRILTATQIAVNYWRAGDYYNGKYWLGHAIHMIEDSFSTAHATRSGANLRTIADSKRRVLPRLGRADQGSRVAQHLVLHPGSHQPVLGLPDHPGAVRRGRRRRLPPGGHPPAARPGQRRQRRADPLLQHRLRHLRRLLLLPGQLATSAQQSLRPDLPSPP
jgi:hypothetical protein